MDIPPLLYTTTQFAALNANNFPNGQQFAITDDGNKLWEARGADGAQTFVPLHQLDFDDLTDVDMSTVAPTDDQAPLFDAGTSTWVPGDVVLGRHGGKSISRVANVSGAVTIGLADGNDHLLTLTGNVTSMTLTGATANRLCAVTVQLVQDGTGGRTVVWPGVTWLAGEEPIMPSDPGDIFLLVFWTFNNGTTWYGAPAGGSNILGYATDAGDGVSTTIVITHNLNTLDVIVVVYDQSGATPTQIIPDSVELTNANTVTIVAPEPIPATDDLRVVVVGI